MLTGLPAAGNSLVNTLAGNSLVNKMARTST